jgi:hypothetical protein
VLSTALINIVFLPIHGLDIVAAIERISNYTDSFICLNSFMMLSKIATALSLLPFAAVASTIAMSFPIAQRVCLGPGSNPLQPSCVLSPLPQARNVGEVSGNRLDTKPEMVISRKRVAVSSAFSARRPDSVSSLLLDRAPRLLPTCTVRSARGGVRLYLDACRLAQRFPSLMVLCRSGRRFS